jgi:hypothetical protein
MKIAVRDRNNQPIGLGRSFIRILVLTLPALFNNWSIPIYKNFMIVWLISFLIFGLGGAIVYTMLFNRKSRQGIHDLLLGTYVVYLPGKPIESFPTTARIHWNITGIWVGLVTVGSLAISLINFPLISNTPSTSSKDAYDILQNDSRFFSAGFNSQAFHDSNGNTSYSLIITVWYKGKPGEGEKEELTNSIAKTVFENEKDINEYDGMQIKILSGYDIGIANANVSSWVSNSVDEWRKEIYPNGSSSGFTPATIAFDKP